MSFVTDRGAGVQRPQDVSVVYDLSSATRIQQLLRQSNYIALSRISCVSMHGCFVLCGSLPNYYLKQLAQELAGNVVGLDKIRNCIQVNAVLTRAPKQRIPVCDCPPDVVCEPSALALKRRGGPRFTCSLN
jgi:hypothetical protein